MNKPDDHEALLIVQEVLQVVMNNVPRHSGKNLDGLKTARSYLEEIEKELQLQILKLEERMWVVAAIEQGLFLPPEDQDASASAEEQHRRRRLLVAGEAER